MIKGELMRGVFWVDQESFLRMMVDKTLKLAGIEIHSVESAEASVYIIKDLNPDLLVWDIVTLKEEGAEVLKQIMETTQIPVGLVGFPDQYDESIRELLPNANVPFLEKPLSSLTLVDQLIQMREHFLSKN